MISGGLRIAVLIDDGFDDDAVDTIVERFARAGLTPTFVGSAAGRQYSGRQGRSMRTSDATASSVRSVPLAAIVIPGGYAPDRLRMRHAMLDLVRDAVAAGIPIGAIGHGPQVLISASVISGRTVTCWPSIAIDVTNAGGLYVDRPAVEDRGVITARKADDAAAFTEALLDAVAHAPRSAGNDRIR